MKDHCAERRMGWLCWLTLAPMLYGASFFVVMAIVCRCGIQLSDEQLHAVWTAYRPVYKVLPSSVMSKGLEVCAGLSEIEAFFFFNRNQRDHRKTW